MQHPDTGQLVRVFGRIGLLSFGGPAAQIALMQRELVENHRWLSQSEFLRALSFCMLLPGPEAMQLATYAGWRVRGTLGGLIAGGLFVLPGALVIFALAYGYAAFGALPMVQSAFTGIKAAVLVIVLQALFNLSRKALVGPAAWGLAGSAFLGVFALGIPFPAIIAVAAIFGAVTLRDTDTPRPEPVSVPMGDTLRRLATWGALWALPILVLIWSDARFLTDIALFFSKLAVVTFGGAYAVLAYMTQTVVSEYGWITTEKMIDALGLAETTPGPLILVTQFVAILAGITAQGPMLGLVAGLTALWVTFVPCFLWIFVAAPYLDTLTSRPRLNAALQAITAAVVGVILNLALWFAVHVFFAEVTSAHWHAAPLPVVTSLDLQAVSFFALAALLIFGLKRPILQALSFMAGAGVLASLL